MSSKSSPRDFSVFSLFTAGLACLVPFASAYTQPVGNSPEGNPISEPGLDEAVPAGKPFAITWQPTTSGTVTLLLLKGPSTNAVPQYPIVEKIPNTGTYTWTPSTDLTPGSSGYGIQLIDDANGQYQYSTQFGISNPDYSSSSSSSSSTSSTASGISSSSSSGSKTSSTSETTSSGWGAGPTGYGAGPNGTETGATGHPTGYPSGTGAWTHASHNGTATKPTGWGTHNSTTIIKATGHMTVPASLKTSTAAATTTAMASAANTAAASATAPAPTGGASTLATSFVGLVFAAGVAVFAL